MKKKTITICLVIMLLAIGIAGGSLAYFTGNDSATNTFTVGNVDIDLLEPSWDGDGNGQQIADPGVAVAKDPYVKNVGKNDAWIRVNVTVSEAAAFKAAMAAHNLTDLNAIFGGHPAGDWTLAGTSEDSEKDTITYSYYYNQILPSGNNTSYLFTTVTLPAKFTNEDVKEMGGDFVITVTADAIQSNGFDTVEAAFKAFDGE